MYSTTTNSPSLQTIAMIESPLNLNVDAEEHEMINIALGHMLDAVAEMTTEKNERILILERVREKSWKLWEERFKDV